MKRHAHDIFDIFDTCLSHNDECTHQGRGGRNRSQSGLLYHVSTMFCLRDLGERGSRRRPLSIIYFGVRPWIDIVIVGSVLDPARCILSMRESDDCDIIVSVGLYKRTPCQATRRIESIDRYSDLARLQK